MHQAHRGAPRLGPYSVVQYLRRLMGQTLYCSAASAGLCVVVRGAVGGEATVMAPPSAGDSALSPCFHGCPLSSTGFSHHSLLPHIPSIRLLQSTAALALGLLHNPYPPAPSPCAACGMCAARAVWFSFHLGCHRSAISLSALNVSLLTQTIAPMWGSDPCFRSPTCGGQVQAFEHSHFPP